MGIHVLDHPVFLLLIAVELAVIINRLPLKK